MRVFAGHGCGNQNVGPFEPRRRTHNLEQPSEGLKAEETQERSHTSLYGNTPAENTSPLKFPTTFACVLATHPTHPFFPHAHLLSF
ncbi:uncharacterized protein B0T23DRAFT_349350 [Neurospora hispaniola]|uniref:Uncharacterized protein n=1 Tax=Neurospora hispaniola TaxID=588809 RepID=A0AAJ0IFA8_9PEZI|nr:hypothetical protein B0T23DRAFT_349350 [Neurospora hispaniola]